MRKLQCNCEYNKKDKSQKTELKKSVFIFGGNMVIDI